MTVDARKQETQARLLAAAAAEFNSAGFHGTDSNRIARRAGFAPQTFYRHFADKTAIFLAAYAAWQAAEARAVRAVAAEGATAIATAIAAQHAEWRIFRRSLRLLAVEDPRVRAARAEARLAQLSALGLPLDAARLAALLCVERIADALAEEEFADAGCGRGAGAELAKAVAALLAR